VLTVATSRTAVLWCAAHGSVALAASSAAADAAATAAVGGIFGQFVPQLQRGMATSAANETTHVLKDIWLDGWNVQAQYIFSTPPPHLPEPVLGAVAELVPVKPGDHLRTRIHYDESEGAWVLQIGVVEEEDDADRTAGRNNSLQPQDPRHEPVLNKAKTSTLKVTTPFMGVNPLFPAPYKGNTSCPDYHQFVLGDLHEAWNMNTPQFCERTRLLHCSLHLHLTI
jgi:hypothetical protein